MNLKHMKGRDNMQDIDIIDECSEEESTFQETATEEEFKEILRPLVLEILREMLDELSMG